MQDEKAIRASLHETVEKRRTVHHGHVADVDVWDVTLPDGRSAIREIIRHPGAAAVIPVDDAGNVTMVYQFRHPLGRVTLEVPAGKRENGEDFLVCARRELQEEVGLLAENFTPLTDLATSPGIFDERIAIYLATGLTPCALSPDEDEFLNVRTFPLDELIERVKNNEIQDSKTIVALMLAREALQKK